MDKFILNITKNYYAKFLYFADKNSFLIEEIENLFKINNKKELYLFIENSTILQINEKNILHDNLDINENSEEIKNSLLNYFNVKNNSVNKIEILNNILPFNHINNLLIDKTLLKNLDNFYELRKEIKNIEIFINDYNNSIILNNLSIIFINNNTNSGQYNKINEVITIKTNNLNPSSLYHEFFHVLDNYLSKKYKINDLFSNLNIPKKELKLFNQFIENMDSFNEKKETHKETFNLYYKKYLGGNFEKEIKTIEDIKFKIANIKYLEFEIIIDKRKLNYINSISEEIMSHICYISDNNIKPKRNLYSIFSDILDLELSPDKSYIAKTSEKLARIYQSTYPNDKDSLFPLGEEQKKLSETLVYIINNEIKPLFKNINHLNKINELRQMFNNDIKKKIKNAL